MGGAVLIRQTSLSSGSLENMVLELIQDPKKIRRMETNSKKNGLPNATKTITNVIMKIAES